MPDTFDSASSASVTFTNNNLTITNTGTTATNQGAKVLDARSAGLYYFEVKVIRNATPGADVGFGIGTDASTYTNMGASAIDGCAVFVGSGNMWVNGVQFAGNTLSSIASGTWVGVAINFNAVSGNAHMWFKKLPSGLWNGNATADPVAGINGVSINPVDLPMEPFCMFGGTGGTVGNAFTFNFGSQPWQGILPSGYVQWDPTVLPPKSRVLLIH